jgi:hypothetical protein
VSTDGTGVGGRYPVSTDGIVRCRRTACPVSTDGCPASTVSTDGMSGVDEQHVR